MNNWRKIFSWQDLPDEEIKIGDTVKVLKVAPETYFANVELFKSKIGEVATVTEIDDNTTEFGTEFLSDSGEPEETTYTLAFSDGWNLGGWIRDEFMLWSDE